MGAAKLPEQIVQRAEEGLRAIEEDRRRDPVIERLMAQPVNRKIEPEEKNRRRKLSPGALKGTRTVAKRLIIESKLKDIRQQIATLRWSHPDARTKTVDERIAFLRHQARRLREMLPGKASKRSKRHRSKRPKVR